MSESGEISRRWREMCEWRLDDGIVGGVVFLLSSIKSPQGLYIIDIIEVLLFSTDGTDGHCIVSTRSCVKY